MMTLALIVGLWTSTCIQTQIAGSNHGYAQESYEITETGDFEFSRKWFDDAQCTEAKGEDLEHGSVKLGSKLSGMFITGETYEADFTTDNGTDLGSIAVKKGVSLKVGRGMKGSSFRNTMVGLFEYSKN